MDKSITNEKATLIKNTSWFVKCCIVIIILFVCVLTFSSAVQLSASKCDQTTSSARRSPRLKTSTLYHYQQTEIAWQQY